MESIPFSETRNYVQRIIENLQVYRARLNEGQTTPLNITEDMAGQFARDLPALPDDFVAALREAQAAEAAMEEAQVEQGPDAPVLTGPETGEDGGADRR